MIVTVTPNPAIDEAYFVPEFRPGRWFRASSVERTPGGRGINVSLVLRELGYSSVATGFVAGYTGDFIRDNLLNLGITTNFIKIKGENRTNTYVVDELGGVETGLTDIGPKVSPGQVERFFADFDRLMKRTDCVVMGGSIPPGVPNDFFRQIIERARLRNTSVFLDAFGPPLEEALLAQPTVVKIDQRFMNSIGGIPLSSIDNLLLISKKIFDQGVDWIITSYFNNCSLFYTPRGVFMAEIPRREIVSVFGAGDSLMAGMAVARQEGMDVQETIRFAMGCVLADVQHVKKGIPSRALVEASMPRVQIDKIS